MRCHHRAAWAVGVALLLATALGCATAPTSVERHVRELASEAMAGRLTGTAGERRAADYLVERLRRLGATPLPGRNFEIPFDFAAGSRDAGSSLILQGGDHDARWEGADRVRALSFSTNERVSGDVIFAGYGLTLPETHGLPYDSYAGLDVQDKIVVVLRYFPEDLDHARRTQLARYAGLRYKALNARERGARALLVVTGPRSPNAGRTVPMTFDSAVSGSGIAAVSVSGEVADAIFAFLPGAPLETLQADLDRGDPHATGTAIPGLVLELDVRIERERRSGTNVVGLLPATGGDDAPSILVGAHYDHLGTGVHGASLAREDERGEIHLGADDNASGAAAVLRIGEVLAPEPRRRDVVLAFWSGEELGLLGSSAFLEQEILDADGIAASLNFDMVGRVRDNTLAVQGVGTSAAWAPLIERANETIGMELALHDDPHLPTDSTVFNAARVPTLNFFSGAHSDYHRPTDSADRINYPDLERIAQLGAGVVRGLSRLDDPPRFAVVERSNQSGRGSAPLRVYTGTIPDYTSDAEGLALADVVKGGPAAEAGLRGGDLIVRFGAQRITNIYDYTWALDAAKIAEPIEVIYLRDGARRTTTLVPRARE
jgi:hypothetical protein